MPKKSPTENAKPASKAVKSREKFSDVKDVEAKLERLKIHYEKNKQDKRAMRDREKTFSKLRRLKAYHNIQ